MGGRGRRIGNSKLYPGTQWVLDQAELHGILIEKNKIKAKIGGIKRDRADAIERGYYENNDKSLK